MEIEQTCGGSEGTQRYATSDGSSSVDSTTVSSLRTLPEKDKSPEAFVAKLFGKTENDLARIKKSMQIAENVVLGPSTSVKEFDTGTAVVGDQTYTKSSGETLPPSPLVQTSVNAQERDSNPECTQVPKGTCLDKSRETRIPPLPSMDLPDIQKDQSDNDFQGVHAQVQKGSESKTYPQASETEKPSILSVLSNMAAEAGMEEVDTVTASTTPVQQTVHTSPKSSLPEMCNDYVPVASNISFDYSIASLINNENSVSKDLEDSVVVTDKEYPTSSPITSEQSNPSHSTSSPVDKLQLVSNPTEKVPVVSNNLQDTPISRHHVASAITQSSRTVSNRDHCGQSLPAGQPISKIPSTIQSSSFQQQERVSTLVSQQVTNSGTVKNSTSISTAPISNVSRPLLGPSTYQIPDLNLSEQRDFDALTSIFPEPHIQPHMMPWSNFNVAQPTQSPMQAHHSVTSPAIPSCSLSQHSPVMQTNSSPTPDHQGAFALPLQSPVLPHRGTQVHPVQLPSSSPQRSSRIAHGGMMLPPEMPQHNTVSRLTVAQDQASTRQLNTGMSFTHPQQTALTNSGSANQNQYYGNTSQPNQLTEYNTSRDLAPWQVNQANAWRGPLGMGMQGREGYGQFHEFRVRPQRQEFNNAISHSHQNAPGSVYGVNMGIHGQFPNMTMQSSAAHGNITMELTRFAAELQAQTMHSSAVYQRPQIPAQNFQRPPAHQHPRASSAANPSQRGIPLASIANLESSNKTRPAQQYNAARTGQIQNNINNHRSQVPLQQNPRPDTRFLARPQICNPQPSQSMRSSLNRQPTPPIQNNLQPQFRSPQPAKRLPAARQPAVNPTSQPSTTQQARQPAGNPTSRPSTTESPVQQKNRPVQANSAISSRTPITLSTPTQKSTKTATTSAPSSSSNSDLNSQSLAALVVESVLKGHDTNHVEQQIRLVNELMKGTSSSSSSTPEQSRTGSQSASQNKTVESSSASSNTTLSSRRTSSRSESMPPPPRPSNPTSLDQNSQVRKKPGRPQEMFVDLTDDEPTATSSTPKRKNPNMDIHVLIEVVNTKSQDLQFCILEKCLRNECKPKHITRCHSTHNWWVYQSEKKTNCPTNEDVVSVAKQILHKSVYEKAYFREQMTAILHSQDFKRAKIFQALCTQKIHVVGRAFQRPKAQSGLLYLNALKDFPASGNLDMYLSATTANNIMQTIARITGQEQPRKNEPQVLVIEPIPDSTSPVQIEPEMPPNEPVIPPLSAEERYTLENQQPIVIEPPPTPAATSCFASEDDISPVVIEPQVSAQCERSLREKSPNGQQQLLNAKLHSQIPLVIATSTLPKAPSPGTEQRNLLAGSYPAPTTQPNCSGLQDRGVMQTPPQMQVQASKQTTASAPSPTLSGYMSHNMPRSMLDVLNSNAPINNQPELWQYQSQLQFNINNQLQIQQKQQQTLQGQQKQILQTHQQLPSHHQKTPSPTQFPATQRMLQMSNRDSENTEVPAVANISEQEMPVASQTILQGVVPQPTPFMGETALPIVLSKNPAAPDSVTQPNIPMDSSCEIDKATSLPTIPEVEANPATTMQEVTQEQMSTVLTVAPVTNSMVKNANKKNSPKGHHQQEKLDALGDGSGPDREFISLEDFITMSTDNGREVCASVSSSIDGDKKEAETPYNEQPKPSLPDNQILEDNERDVLRKDVQIKMERIEDVCGSLGLKLLSNGRYKIKATSILLKPRRATVQRKFAVDDGIALDDLDKDPAWEGISSHNSSTDEYSEDENSEDSGKGEYKRICIRIKRSFSTSSDEDEVKNCDFYDSSSESPRKSKDRNKPRRRKKKKLQIDSATNGEKSPGTGISSESHDESPVKVQRRKRRVIDSDDDSPFKKADPVFPPSPGENKSAQGSPSQPHSPIVPSVSRSELSKSELGVDARSTSDVTSNIQKLGTICPSLQPRVQVARLTPGGINRNRKQKYKRKKKMMSKQESSKQTEHQQDKSNKKSCHDSGSETEHFDMDDNTQQADPDSSVPPARDIPSTPLPYELDFFTNEELWEEIQRRQDLISCICGMTFVDRKHYNLHRDLHDKVNPKKCAICCEVFDNWIEFTSHTYSTHNTA